MANTNLINFDNYINKDITIQLVETDTLIIGKLQGYNDYGVFVQGKLSSQNQKASNDSYRFVPWVGFEMIEFTNLTSQERLAG